MNNFRRFAQKHNLNLYRESRKEDRIQHEQLFNPRDTGPPLPVADYQGTPLFVGSDIWHSGFGPGKITAIAPYYDHDEHGPVLLVEIYLKEDGKHIWDEAVYDESIPGAYILQNVHSDTE